MVKGMVRRIDDLRRVCIPKEYRKNLNITEGDGFNVTLHEDGMICLEPHRIHCVFYSAEEDETFIKNRGVLLCRACAEDIVDEVLSRKEDTV